MKTCSINGCAGKHLAKGFCGKHYAANWYSNNTERAREIARDSYHRANPSAKTREQIASDRPVKCADCEETKVIAKGLCRNCYHKTYQREKDIERKRVARIANPQKHIIDGRKRRELHPDQSRAAVKKWHAKNPEYVRVKDATRRARKCGVGGKYTLAQIKKLMTLQKGLCAVCHADITKKHHRDHIKPLASGGSNDILNIQLLCPSCNQSKHHRDPIEFMQSRGFLL